MNDLGFRYYFITINDVQFSGIGVVAIGTIEDSKLRILKGHDGRNQSQTDVQLYNPIQLSIQESLSTA